MLPAQSATAQSGAAANTSSSANESASVDSRAKADAAKQAAAKAKEDGQAKADAQANAYAHGDVKLKAPSWQTVLDRLFGTPENGLLDGKKAFDFQAKDVSLTANQSAAFFSSTSASTENLAALIKAAEAVHGTVRIDGTIDGKGFDLKLAGRELKLDGLTLTTAQRDLLVTELRGISGLHEVKIDALVDGRATMIVLAGGQERIQLLGRDRGDSVRGDGKQKIEVDHRAEIDHRVEIERPTSVDTHERVENTGRIIIEKPELPRVGK
jgi:hypothetical protein